MLTPCPHDADTAGQFAEIPGRAGTGGKGVVIHATRRRAEAFRIRGGALFTPSDWGYPRMKRWRRSALKRCGAPWLAGTACFPWSAGNLGPGWGFRLS